MNDVPFLHVVEALQNAGKVETGVEQDRKSSFHALAFRPRLIFLHHCPFQSLNFHEEMEGFHIQGGKERAPSILPGSGIPLLEQDDENE